VKADPAHQLLLLELQAHDLALDQLAHRRRTLPELAQLDESAAALAGFEGEVATAQAAASELETGIKRVEREVEQVRDRAARDRQRMDSGAITSPKELENLQHEVQTLARRQASLEDDELVLMEEKEAADAAVADVERRAAEERAAQAALVERRDAAFAAIDAEAVDHRGPREKIVPGVPDDLLALYEKIRAAQAGIGAAMLRARRCEGCRLELSGSELAAVRAAADDEVVRCEECRRILVRTAESGL
jgi:predicted  nucleic acid-binding Zn-ribbon protein